MAYTKKVTEKYWDPFPTRLRQLMEDNSCTQKALAEHLEITAQAIGAYCRGETKPTLAYAQEIADYFCVSLDYLSGRTDVSSRDDNLHIAHNATGLSEFAIKKLSEINRQTIIGSAQITLINEMLVDEYFLEKAANLLYAFHMIPEESVVEISFHDKSNKTFKSSLISDNSDDLKRLYMADLQNIIFTFLSTQFKK